MKNPLYRARVLVEKAGVSPETVDRIFEALSMGVDTIPVVGNIKMFIQATTGYDLNHRITIICRGTNFPRSHSGLARRISCDQAHIYV
jgi:hypothetical protein